MINIWLNIHNDTSHCDRLTTTKMNVTENVQCSMIKLQLIKADNYTIKTCIATLSISQLRDKK